MVFGGLSLSSLVLPLFFLFVMFRPHTQGIFSFIFPTPFCFVCLKYECIKKVDFYISLGSFACNIALVFIDRHSISLVAVTAQEGRASSKEMKLAKPLFVCCLTPAAFLPFFFLFFKALCLLSLLHTLSLFYTRPRQLQGLKMDYDDDDYDQYRQYEDEMYKDPTDER